MPEQDPTIFISARHAEASLVDALSRGFKIWGIPKEKILSSSHPGKSVQPGSEILEDVLGVVRSSDYFLLLYKFPSEDWWWCSYEFGVATSGSSKEKKFAVLHFGERFRMAGEEVLQIDIRKREELTKLVTLIGGNLDDDIIEQRADGLYLELKDFVTIEHERELHTRNFMMLKLNQRVVEEIREESGKRSVIFQKWAEPLAKNLEIGSGTQNSSLRKFGFQDFEDGLSFDQLVAKIRSSQAQDAPNNSFSQAWEKQFLEEIIRSIRNIPAVKKTASFQSVADYDEKFYTLDVIRTRRLVDRSMEFDVYLHEVEFAGEQTRASDEYFYDVLDRKFASDVSPNWVVAVVATDFLERVQILKRKTLDERPNDPDVADAQKSHIEFLIDLENALSELIEASDSGRTTEKQEAKASLYSRAEVMVAWAVGNDHASSVIDVGLMGGLFSLLAVCGMPPAFAAPTVISSVCGERVWRRVKEIKVFGGEK